MSKAAVPKTPGGAQADAGIGVVSFLTALASGSVFFLLQLLIFLLLRNHLDRIFKPKTYLTPASERTLPPPKGFWRLIGELGRNDDREVIEKCGLDAYFFLRYLKVLLVIFVPIACVTMPVLLPLNYIGGRGRGFNADRGKLAKSNSSQVTGLDTLAWGNVNSHNTDRYWAHLVVSVLSVLWVLFVFSMEMRVYVTIRQQYLTTKAHRSKVSASTVLVRSIPQNWLSEEPLRDLFSIFPGGVRRIWLNRNLSSVMAKIALRDVIHQKLESAETALIRSANRAARKNGREKEISPQLDANSMPRQPADCRTVMQGRNNMETPASLNSPESQWLSKPPVARSRTMPSLHIQGSIVRGIAELETGSSAPDVSLHAGPGRGMLQTMAKAGGQVRKRAMTTNGFSQLPTLTETPEEASAYWEEGAGVVAEDAVCTPPLITRLHHTDRDYGPGAGSWWRLWKSPPSGPDRRSASWHATLFGKGSRNHPDYDFQYADGFHRDCLTNWKQGLWKDYLRPQNRPTSRLPLFGLSWLPGLPLLSKSVDTIEWCRKELCRLNFEIDVDKKHQERFPLLDCAFIQFNEQIAAYMAGRNEIYRRPGRMTTSIVETSPKDIIWESIGIGYRESWSRSTLSTGILLLMISFWSVPVAWSGALSQIDTLIDAYAWLAFVRRVPILRHFLQAVAGLLPAAMLAIMLLLLPFFLAYLATLKGVQTHSLQTQFIQKYYFIFLFIQVFLVASIASFFTASVSQFASNIKSLQRVVDIMNVLARNLPKAANYFYSYMLLQALSASSATLLQAATLMEWYLLSPIFDATARQKWSRNTRLNSARYGALFPVYTNFACIALIYCTISPLISVFAILTFGLFWIAQKYTALYVNKFDFDTGGKLYPRAINQTFTGLYTMELCVSGLFFIIRDANGKASCIPQGVIMLLLLAFTVFCQVIINQNLASLSNFLPVMLRFHSSEDISLFPSTASQSAQNTAHCSPRERTLTMMTALYSNSSAQSDELPKSLQERLERSAFQHAALRSPEPTVWIPQDPLGIADDEIRQSRELSSRMRVSSHGTALDRKARVTYGRNPPDILLHDTI